jgi:hypothetical protein
MRRLAILLPLLLAGCGSDAPPSVEAVTTCLKEKRVPVTGGPAEPAPGDDDAPDRGELIVPGAFIAFYSTEEVADKLAAGVEANAKRIKATVERRGTVTVIFTDTRSRDEIDSCLSS